jgi:hypothetical protein
MTHRIPALIVLLSLTACGSNLAQEPAAAFRARVDSAIAATDTAQLASLAEARCASLDNVERQSCYEDYFLALADSGRVSLALGALEHLGRLRPEVESD